MNSKEIRSLFLDFFSRKDHLILPSFSLIPQNDPTLLLIGAGMAPLKPYFVGEKNPPHPRVATCQKCVRTPDIERVGVTGRHATFFEMLGNFSFGNYFKESAILWAWQLVTEHFKLAPEKLWVSYYEEDEEAFNIWRNEIGLESGRIIPLGKEDNFWEIGPGPCGPCSEIYFDLGPEAGCGKPGCRVGCSCDRYLEIWNLVFTQFNRLPSGELSPLEHKNIDTGAGLERLAVVLQGKKSLYQIDTVAPLVEFVAQEAGLYNPEHLSLRIVAEHLRGITFLVADGVLPSNEGRGYVLRRLLRRALRHGKLLGIEESFLYRSVPLVISLMEQGYPELKQREDYIIKIVETEEKRFQDTLKQGMQILDEQLQELLDKKQKVFPGQTAFRLYDTYGFPLDLTREIVGEKGLIVEEEEFMNALEEQRGRARSAHKMQGGLSDSPWEETRHLSTVFQGYQRLEGKGKVVACMKEGAVTEEAEEGTTVEIILDRTPFYPESGGQEGDTGTITGDEFEVSIEKTYSNPYDQIVHRGRVTRGCVKTGSKVQAKVERETRQALCRAHSATHLLHRVLKDHLGEHVNQAGSLVAPDRIRFDFTHFASISPEELGDIEAKVNQVIRDDLPVSVLDLSLEEAREMGAVALFDYKYEERVRVVRIDSYSLELCGGTHLKSTGQAGFFKITGEESVGAGVRRIEACTGEEALKYVSGLEKQLNAILQAFKISPGQAEQKINDWLQKHHNLQEGYASLQSKLITLEADSLLSKVRADNGIKVLSEEVSADNMEVLRELADRMKEKLSRSVVVLGAVREGKVLLVATATPDLLKEGIHAGNLVSEVARLVGGGGGGRPDMAQAGGKEPSALPAALGEVENLIRKQREKYRE